MAKVSKPVSKVEMVKVKVVKFGSGKVSTGEHVSGEGDIMLEAGETIECPKATALDLETRGFAEIV